MNYSGVPDAELFAFGLLGFLSSDQNEQESHYAEYIINNGFRRDPELIPQTSR